MNEATFSEINADEIINDHKSFAVQFIKDGKTFGNGLRFETMKQAEQYADVERNEHTDASACHIVGCDDAPNARAKLVEKKGDADNPVEKFISHMECMKEFLECSPAIFNTIASICRTNVEQREWLERTIAAINNAKPALDELIDKMEPVRKEMKMLSNHIH